uniref:Ig-like domain-containing protein n=1 Tax=Poecilia reticulata TaxID=8081 RepID=A0A3P9N1T8_POERE
WPVYRGETVTLRCEIQDDGGTQWTYEWRPAYRNVPKSSEYRINNVSESDRGNYGCKARSDHQITGWSSAFTLTVNGKSIFQFLIFSLTHSKVEPQKIVKFQKFHICITYYVMSRPTVTLQPNWSVVFRGETVTLRCEIQDDGGRTQWNYEWSPANRNAPTSSEYRISSVSESDSGNYWCKASGGHQNTGWSFPFRLTVRFLITPTVIQQPNWTQIYKGETVTLRCEIQDDGGTQWTYEWRPTNRNSPSSSEYRITADSSGDYKCRGRRDRFTSTQWGVIRLNVSYPHPAASLSVSPDRVQHVIDQSVTLNCSGNDSKWRVRRFTETTNPSHVQCSNWGTMHGSSCTINRLEDHSGVYWCESGSGEFSNAVNITVQLDYYDGIILLSPVHPVTERYPVTLSCRDKQQNLLSNVFFYHNDKLIHNDSKGELNIFAVSKSDEGFYKCQHSGKDSPRSWMSVRGEEEENFSIKTFSSKKKIVTIPNVLITILFYLKTYLVFFSLNNCETNLTS